MKTTASCLPVLVLLPALLLLTCKTSTVSTPAGTIPEIPDDSLLTLTQYRTFQYFWDGAEPVSGMARERYHVDGLYPENDKNVVTTGGTGFGLMAILVGIERGFITREDGFKRLDHIADFLKTADRFHGAWPHWLYGETGLVKPFSPKDNGADIVETAYLVQGLLTVRQYFRQGNEQEKKLAMKIDRLWREVEWNWFTQGGKHVIYWQWCKENPLHYAGYSDSCWGLTAGYSPIGYSAHAPGDKNDLGVITPSAALSSFPYSPAESMNALKHFYYELGDSIFGQYGFYDGFSLAKNWFPKRYLAIDQGPIVVMIENYRSALLWDLFMSSPEIRNGLQRLGFSVKD